MQIQRELDFTHLEVVYPLQSIHPLRYFLKIQIHFLSPLPPIVVRLNNAKAVDLNSIRMRYSTFALLIGLVFVAATAGRFESGKRPL